MHMSNWVQIRLLNDLTLITPSLDHQDIIHSSSLAFVPEMADPAASLHRSREVTEGEHVI
jgi:hypothetical protein